MCRNSNIFERNQPYFPLTCTADDRPENVPGKSWMRKNALGCLAWDGVWAWNRVCERAAPVTHCTCWERGTSSSFSSSSRGNPRPGPPDVRWVRIVSHSQALTLCDCSRSRSYSPTSGIFACAKSFSWKPSRGDSVFLRSSYHFDWAAAFDSTPLHSINLATQWQNICKSQGALQRSRHSIQIYFRSPTPFSFGRHYYIVCSQPWYPDWQECWSLWGWDTIV